MFRKFVIDLLSIMSEAVCILVSVCLVISIHMSEFMRNLVVDACYGKVFKTSRKEE